MSLVTSASLWTNDESLNKKRPSTMRKTIKMRPFAQNIGEPDEYVSQSESYEQTFSDASIRNRTNIDNEPQKSNPTPTTIDETVNVSVNRNNRVNELLNKITSTSNPENSGNSLANFTPLSNPSINIKKNTDVAVSNTLPPVELQTNQWRGALTSQHENNAQFSGATVRPNVYSNYNTSYQGKMTDTSTQPYYAKMGIGNNTNNDKLMEKVNYLISIMEQNQVEKTNNITEEFILYTFLGVFIIFVVDSFSKAAKYTR